MRKNKSVVFIGIVFATIFYSGLLTYTFGHPYKTYSYSPNEYIFRASMETKKIIWDMDPGVDDAMGLLLMIANPKPDYPEIIAITCSQGNGNVTQSTLNALKTLHLVQKVHGKTKRIPVYIGANASLIQTPTSDFFFGKDAFGDIPDNDPPSMDEIEKEHAVQAMIRLVKENPGEITLVVTGPLTNIALAIRMDPTFRRDVKQIYWMGGSVEGVGNMKPSVEFNAYMDPEANYIVFNSTGSPIIVFPWEACSTNNPTSQQWRKNVLGKVNSPYIEFLNKIEAISMTKTDKWTACDGKTVAVMLDGNVANKVTSNYVVAIYQGEQSRGMIVVDYAKSMGMKSNAVIIHSINKDKFQDMCINNLS